MSLVQVEGADVFQYALDKESARNAIRFRKARNESARGDLQTFREAMRIVKLSREQSTPLRSGMFLPDIAAEIEDFVNIEGTDYVIDGYSIVYGRTEKGRDKIKWDTKYNLRQKLVAGTVGEWHAGSGSSVWGEVYWG